jgi:inosine/xanthosine triphosphate pyrophosphatase family protein
MKSSRWVLNTSNQGKMAEFRRLFDQYKITLFQQSVDLREIDAGPVTVVVYKASQMNEGVLVEDTSLDVEGADIGINIRWVLGHLSKYIGRKAEWRVLLAHQKQGKVYVYEGTVKGRIVAPRGNGGFGFDPFFVPENSQYTLAESKPDEVNARAKAVEALVHDRPIKIESPMTLWKGPWQ